MVKSILKLIFITYYKQMINQSFN